MYESIQEVMEKKRIKLSWCKNRNTPYNWAQRDDRSLPFIIYNSLHVSSPPPPSRKYNNSKLKQIPYNKLLRDCIWELSSHTTLKPAFHMIAIATIAGNWFPYDRYDRYDRCDRWTFFFSAIVAITREPGLREDNKASADASFHE